MSELFSTRRIESLTDGVFAFAMTLLVLTISIPVLKGTASNQTLWQALVNLTPNLISFSWSFFILGAMWFAHLRQFEYIKKVDHLTSTLNTLRLFIVALIPFTTNLNGHYSNLEVGQIFFPLSLFLLALATYIQGKYVASKPVFYETYNKPLIDSGLRRSLGFVVVSALVCIGTVFIGTFAFFGYLLQAIINPIVSRSTSQQL